MNPTAPSPLSCTRLVRGCVLALAVSMLAACGTDDGGARVEDPGTAAGTAAPAPMPPAGGSTAMATDQEIAVRVTDQGVEVSPATARPGPATFQVTNNATRAQEIEIDGPGEDGEIDNLPPNGTRSVRMTLEAGDYEIKSEHEGAPDQSRRTRLVVQN